MSITGRYSMSWHTFLQTKRMLEKSHLLMFLIAAIGTITTSLNAQTPDAELNRLVKLYSSQRIVSLNVNENYKYQLKNRVDRVIRLVSVQEHRDNVIHLMRRAEVRVEIDGRPLDLVCMPYVMPTETVGLRLQVDSTSGWGNIPKRVQLSVWDATDPIVNTKRFVFPIRNFRFFSHTMQAYNEPVHLSWLDGPGGCAAYHDYGFDMAGYEGGEELLSAGEGKAVAFWNGRENPWSVCVEDCNGFILDYAHFQLKSVGPEINLNSPVARGQKLGVLGTSGAAFSHLHMGTYLRLKDCEADQRNCRLNLYPWLVAAYQAQHPTGLLAVARPYHFVLTGEKVVFDGSNSFAWGGRKIVEWRWILPDGKTVNQVKAEQVFDKLGTYVATLWVKDDRGAEDVDFCQVKVYAEPSPKVTTPHIFMTYTSTQDIRQEQPVKFRFSLKGPYPKGDSGRLFKVDFGDGTPPAGWQSGVEWKHSFKKPGICVVTATCEVAGSPIIQKQKVVVESVPGTGG